ncbi:MAG: 5'-nucleotidase C-terminal domain-containing protein [Oligoflexia bacterium]|nr:5'-nucleotidase C-terminal domain-containing protein [Oligoflexia bacterium]
MTRVRGKIALLIVTLLVSGCLVEPSGKRTITILGTNDIHGSVEAGHDQGIPVGGMPVLAGAVTAIREGLKAKHGNKAGLLVVDAGDQFQGTLLSNYDEGQLVFRLMNEVGYDAVVPGNHDYDFGPIGWLADQVGPDTDDTNPRGAIERLASQAKFPLISANTYLMETLVGLDGRTVEVSKSGCVPRDPQAVVDWSRAARPAFLKPYTVKEVAGVRVALIGIDNVGTPTSTTADNVKDLCFRGEVAAYLDMREELEGKAEVFVLVMHHGNANAGQDGGSAVLREILAARKDSVHLVVAGHTHFVNHERIENVPLIQSGSNGRMFGRADLTYDFDNKRVSVEETQSFAGVQLRTDACPKDLPFCTDRTQVHPNGNVWYEGIQVERSLKASLMIEKAKNELAELSTRHLGFAKTNITRNRIMESGLANFVTDQLRRLTRAEIALVNSPMLRDDLPAGMITYETLFAVIPFANHGVVLSPVPVKRLIEALQRTVLSCGAFGSLMQSGLRVVAERDCTRAKDGADAKARLLTVYTLAGEAIYDADRGGLLVPESRTFDIAMPDFVAGYREFSGIPRTLDIGIFREKLAADLYRNPVEVSNDLDGRYRVVGVAARE